jgi:hypothetical protein
MTDTAEGMQTADWNCLRIRNVFRVLGLVLACAQSFAARNAFGADCRSYVEIARAYLRHDWPMAINAYWSPLYSWFLAIVLGVTKPTLRSEIPVIHFANVLVFLACMATFEFFWSRVVRFTGMRVWRKDLSSLPISALWILGYAAFTWETVGSLLPLVTPDLCVTAVAFLAAGLLVQFHIEDQPLGAYTWFGAVLGVGYLTKSVMFPMAFVFLATSLASQPRRKHAARLALALTIFLVVATPEIVLLSRAKGHLTFSDTHKMSVPWSTYALPNRNWQGQPPGFGVPTHPTRKIYEHPAVFEFNGPIRASYPPWFDPSYWNEGMQAPFQLGTIVNHAARNAVRILSCFTMPKVWLMGILLLVLTVEPAATLTAVSRWWFLVVPSAAVFCLYALTFAEYRFMPAWKILVWAAILAGLRLSARRASLPAYRWLAVVVAFVMLASAANGIRGQYAEGRPDDATPEYQTAEGLRRVGLQSGDKVGIMGFDNDAIWPYLAGFLVVAEIDTQDVCDFWSAPPSVHADVLQRFRQAGARAVVANNGGGIKSTTSSAPADYLTCGAPWTGWGRIEGSANHVYFLTNEDGEK